MRPDFRIGEWTVRPSLNRIERDGQSVQLEPRPMEVLVALAAAAGAVLTRDELLDTVWAGVVVGEESLTRTISELRRALGDDPQSPRYIETIRKGGYRLVAPVEPVAGQAVVPWRALGIAGAAVVLALIGIAVFRIDPDHEPLNPLTSRPLTSLEGEEQWPAISDDGTQVAFAWANPEVGNLEIYAKLVGEATPLRVTEDPGIDAFPVWISGTDSISWVHVDDTGASVRIAAFPGGEPREVLHGRHLVKGFSWIDEGQAILYSDVAQGVVIEDPYGPAPPSRLFVKDLRTGEERLLFEPEPGLDDSFPMLSPDGRQVAFYRAGRGENARLYVVDIDGGEPRLLVDIESSMDGLTWDRDSKSVIFSCGVNGNYSLWRASVDDGSMSWIPVSGEWMFTPVVSRGSDRLVYQHRWFEKDIWQVTRPAPGVRADATSALISSSRWDCEARLSPDGEMIAFISTRSGALEVWTARADGSHPVQVTNFGGPSVGSPAWSPDGSRLVFSASPDGFSDLFLLEPESRNQVRLTQGAENDLFPTWGSTGDDIVFSSDRSGTWQIYRQSLDPDAQPQQLTSDGGIYGREASDGHAVYFARVHEAGLWKTGPDHTQVELTHGPGRGDWNDWDLFADGVIYLDYDQEGEGSGPFLMEFSFDTEQTSIVSGVPNVAAPSISVTTDGRTILYARVERSIVDLMLVEGFR